jgi:hypothetical protein
VAYVVAVFDDLLLGSNVLGMLRAAGHDAQLAGGTDVRPQGADALIVDLAAGSFDGVELVERLRAGDERAFAALVERPLFTPTRRLVRPVEAPPTEPEPQAAAPDEAPPPEAPSGTPRPDLRFFGTMRHGKSYAALVTRPGENGSQALAVGDTVDDWKVAEVDRDRLVLQHDAERYTLSIFVKGEGGPKPPAPQAPGAAQAPASQPEDSGAEEGDSIPPDESATGDNQGDGSGEGAQ